MITVRRKLDDGYGNVYIVQQGSFASLQSLIARINADQLLQIPLYLSTEAFDRLIAEDPQLAQQVKAWVDEHLPIKLDISSLGNPDGHGKEVDAWEIWGT